MNKVSVIVPVYKVPLEYLRACFDSLVAQTMQECEFIIVSDGAPEAECSVCEEYAKKDTRFRFFKRVHAGVSNTRNFGIEQVNGEYIAFVDSDDRIDSNMLEECYSFAKDNPSDITTMDFFVTEKNIDTLRLQKPKSKNADNFIREILSGTLFGGMPLRMINSDFYRSNPVKWRTDLGYCEDVVFWAEFCKANPKISYMNKAFYHYVQDNNNSITRNYTIEKFKERQKYIQILKSILPQSFSKEVNLAAFYVKMEAMQNKMLSVQTFMSFERTTFYTLSISSVPFITKLYLLFHIFTMTVFKKSYKEYL